jgi:uncharacterized protein (TIGR03435 family)
MRFASRGIVTASVLASVVSIVAQTPARPVPAATFEVVSIKPNNSGSTSVTGGYAPGGRFVLVNGPVATLIRFAYPADLPALVGAPDWVSTARYDVTTIASAETTRDQMTPMMRAMLEERLKLKAHYETQDRPIYALKLARDDGRLGPALHASKFDCAAITDLNRRNQPVMTASNGAPPCGMMQSGGVLNSGGQDMPMLARLISGAAGRPVRDKTGLTGIYEFTLRYNTQAGTTVESVGDSPSIFTALQEQLGLKLEADHAPLRVVVIDQIERPSPD